MERSARIVRAIKDLGYPDGRCLSRCSCDELPCPLLSWLRVQLLSACPDVSGRGGEVMLVEELRALLCQLTCPLAEQTPELLEQPLLGRVTEFLVSELQAALILQHKELHPESIGGMEEAPREQRAPAEGDDQDEQNEAMDDPDRTTEMQAEWELLLEAVNMDVCSEFADLEREVQSRLALLPGGEMPGPLLRASLSPQQWVEVEKFNQLLSRDYRCRMEMMIKRFQVTLESFAWGERKEQRRKAVASVPHLASLSRSSLVSLPVLLSARDDLSTIQRVTAGPNRTSVYKVLMGGVPDRGGRPGEIEPPMPAWEGRRAKGSGSGRGPRGGGHQRRKASDKKKNKD